jgi:hypothetical protein
MHRHTQQLLATLAAAITLATVVTTATAARLSVTNQQTRIVWTSLRFENGVTLSMSCAVTLEGSFHNATFIKTRGLLIGNITRAAVQNRQCSGGRATILLETLPWHVTYQSFTGTLPTIAGITFNLIRAGFLIEQPELNLCRAVTTLERPARGIANIGAGGVVTGLRADETASIPLTNGPGGFACGLGSGRFSGTGTVTSLGTTNSISIRLI